MRSKRPKHAIFGPAAMALYLSRSRPRSAFKDLLGNANHLIITALVGLDAIERSIVRDVPEDLHTAWSPQDAVSSAKRSRRLILDMALIRAIDALDVYLREAIRKPAIIQSDVFRRGLDEANLSIFKKMLVVERNCPDLDKLPLAIIFLMIAWRNRSAHSEADCDAPQRHLDVISAQAEELQIRFRGLDAERLLDGYVSTRPAKFKEVASLINAAHHLVADLDYRLLVALDIERFVRDTIWSSLGANPKPTEIIDQTRMRHAVNIWGKDPSDRGGAIIRLLKQHGFSTTAPKERAVVEVPAKLFKKLEDLTPRAVVEWAYSSH